MTDTNATHAEITHLIAGVPVSDLDPSRLHFPVTEDFIAFVFDGPDHVETAENIRFSASTRALAILEQKDLLM